MQGRVTMTGLTAILLARLVSGWCLEAWMSGRFPRLPRWSDWLTGSIPPAQTVRLKLHIWASRLPQRRSAALGAQRRRHVFRRQRERPAAPGGAAQAGGRRGEDQGLAGSCRASTVLHAECLQGCPAGRCSSWKQPLPGAQILCFILKAVRKELTEECFQAQSDE